MTPTAAGVAQDLAGDFATEYGTTHLPVGSTIGGIMLDFGMVQLDTRASSTDGVALGIICVDEDTVAEVARPLPNEHSDWMWYQWLPAPGPAAGAQFSTAAALGGPIRIRSQRKCEELGSHLYLVAQTDGLTTYDFHVFTSTLVLLP